MKFNKYLVKISQQVNNDGNTMALFGSKKDKSDTLFKKVRPTVVRSNNIAKELFNFSKMHDISTEQLDFNLLDVENYIRLNDGTKETDWELISDAELEEISEKELLNPNFQIKQIYEIEMFSKKNHEDLYKDFYLAVGVNATKCKVYLSIKAGSSVAYNPKFENDLASMINRKKARAGILINIFDEMLDSVVSKLSAQVKVQGSVKFKENQTLLIAESYEPTLTVDDALILHYDKQEEIDELDRVDYASRGFIKSVKQDELLIEYVKPKEGKPGRNCRGEFMQPKEPVVNNEPTFGVDDTIKVQETEKSIEYIAKENGYIAYKDKTYSIQTDVDVKDISFRTTGSIVSGVDSDVSISVKEKDAIKDAVGSGMLVEVSEITVNGNVGSNAKIHAQKANIGGQTHKTAQIRADDLKINTHKGMAYGKNVHITRLEHGTVDCDYVDISQAIGGEIRAKDIVIEVCTSYVTAIASKRIEIKKLQGEENVFIIDPMLKKKDKKDTQDTEKKIEDTQKNIKEIQKETKETVEFLKENKASFIDVKKRLMHYKKNGVKMPESFVKQYKQYQRMQHHIEELKEELKIKAENLDLLEKSVNSLQENILDARIINRDRWVGFNEIIFKLIDPPVDITYNPPAGSSGKVFGVVEVSEGEFVIEVVEE